MMNDLIISIVDWNSGQYIIDCLESISVSVKKYSHKTVVVDNNSSYKSTQIISKLFPGTIIIENDKNIGYACAHNQVISSMDSRYLLLLNPDAVLTEQAIDMVLDFMEGNPRVGVAGCRVLSADGTVQNTIIRYPSLGSEILRSAMEFLYPFNSFIKQVYYKYHKIIPNFSTPVIVDAISGCFIMLRSDMIKEIGPLEGSFFLFSEEADLCLRARKLNWNCAYLPQATVHHNLGGCREKASQDFSLYHFYRSRLLYFLKHHGKVQTCILGTTYFIFSLWFLLIQKLKKAICLCLNTSRKDYSEISLATMKAVLHLLAERTGLQRGPS